MEEELTEDIQEVTVLKGGEVKKKVITNRIIKRDKGDKEEVTEVIPQEQHNFWRNTRRKEEETWRVTTQGSWTQEQGQLKRAAKSIKPEDKPEEVQLKPVQK